MGEIGRRMRILTAPGAQVIDLDRSDGDRDGRTARAREVRHFVGLGFTLVPTDTDAKTHRSNLAPAGGARHVGLADRPGAWPAAEYTEGVGEIARLDTMASFAM
jgi:hypothetical protein